MKNYFTLVFVLFIFIAKAQDISPVEYMGLFNVYYADISAQNWEYTSAIARGKKAKKIEKNRQKLLESISFAIQNIKRIKDFNGDNKFKEAYLNYLDVSEKVLKEEYEEIMDLEDIAEQSYDLMEAFILAKEKASEKMNEAQSQLNAEQKRFAKDNDITLLENTSELENKLQKSSLVFKFYNDMYLIFFKSFKNDLYLSDAIQMNDVSAIDQNKTSAKVYGEEGIEKLNKLGEFDGDKLLSNACLELLNFYIKDSENTLAIDFILEQEKLNTMQNVMDKKKKSDITQKDVDNFNSLVKSSNKLLDEFNKYNEQSFKEKSKLVDAWNKQVQSFLDRHVPK